MKLYLRRWIDQDSTVLRNNQKSNHHLSTWWHLLPLLWEFRLYDHNSFTSQSYINPLCFMRDTKKLTCFFSGTKWIYCPQKPGGVVEEQGLKECKPAFVRISAVYSTLRSPSIWQLFVINLLNCKLHRKGAFTSTTLFLNMFNVIKSFVAISPWGHWKSWILTPKIQVLF